MPSNCRRMCTKSLVLIAEAVFLLERRHINRQTDPHTHIVTDAIDHPACASATSAWNNGVTYSMIQRYKQLVLHSCVAYAVLQ